MLKFHDPIPSLAGQQCVALLSLQYWYANELAADPTVLFLKVAGGPWHRFSIDAGVVFWRIVDAPDEPEEEGEHRWVLTDIGAAYGLVGKTLVRVAPFDLPGGGEMRLEFEDTPALILRNVDDESCLVRLA